MDEEKAALVSVKPLDEAEYGGFQITSDNETTASRVSLSDASSWLSNYTEGDSYVLRLITHQDGANHTTSQDVTFDAETYKHVVQNSATYASICDSSTGGAVAGMDTSAFFYLQSPHDGGSSCSFALKQYGHYIRGIYQFDSPEYSPDQLFTDHTLLPVHNNWRWRGEHTLNLPLAFLAKHVKLSIQQLSSISDDVARIEDYLAQLNRHLTPEPEILSSVHGLHTAEKALLKLRVRFSFEKRLLTTIEEAAEGPQKYQYAHRVKEILDIPRGQMEMRVPQDEMLSQRIRVARATVFDSMLLRNLHETLQMRRVNVDIGIASKRVAEATLRDAASMRTIAVMTMIFLPGTAIASFFSMTLFDWSSTINPNHITSSYIWVYFAVAVPLTIAVMAVWWLYHRRLHRGEPVLPDDDGGLGVV